MTSVLELEIFFLKRQKLNLGILFYIEMDLFYDYFPICLIFHFFNRNNNQNKENRTQKHLE